VLPTHVPRRPHRSPPTLNPRFNWNHSQEQIKCLLRTELSENTPSNLIYWLLWIFIFQTSIIKNSTWQNIGTTLIFMHDCICAIDLQARISLLLTPIPIKQWVPICLLEERNIHVAYIHPPFYELSVRFFYKSISRLVHWYSYFFVRDVVKMRIQYLDQLR